MRPATIYIAVIGMAAAACAGATLGRAGDPPPDNGRVSFLAAPGNEIVSLRTKIVVPAALAEPSGADWSLFLWPGLQPRPDDANYLPIGNGVLQSVLSWGRSCAPPDDKPKATWWISGQYVNTYGNPGYQGCYGGPIMRVAPGDKLVISMSVFRSIWSQTVLNLQTKESTGYRASLADQAQGVAWFEIEPYMGALSPQIVFLETTIGFARPHPDNCRLDQHGPDDVASAPVLVDNGQSCDIDEIALKPPTRPQAAKSLLRSR